MSLPIQITVGGGGLNPVAGSTEYNNIALAGISGYVDKEGYGIWGMENYTVLSTGGFRLLNGYVFEQGANYFFVPVGAKYDESAPVGYTNGLNSAKVLPAIFGRLGWDQNDFSLTLNSANLQSKSGRKFNDGSFHALLTLQNIFDTMEQANASASDFNAYLTAFQRSIILRSLNGVFNDPEYICQTVLYDRGSYSNNDQPITNTGKFTGWKLKLPSKVDLATQINSVALYFNEDVTFNLYVFSDVNAAPLFTFEVSAVANEQTIVDLPGCVLNYIGNNHAANYFLGYFQDDLGTAKAIWETNVCFKCNMPFAAIPVQSAATGSTFDKQNITYASVTNGINPHISVFKDPTYQVVNNPALFDNLIGLQAAVMVAEGYKWTMRSNSTERKLNDGDRLRLDLEIDGVAPISEGPKTIGLKQRVQQETQRIKKAFQPKFQSAVIGVC